MAKGNNNKKKLIAEPPPRIQDDLEKQKDEDQKMNRIKKQLSQSLKELLELYEEKSEERFAEAIKGLEFQVLLERLKNKGAKFDEEAERIRVEITSLRNIIIEYRQKAENKENTATTTTKQKAEEKGKKLGFLIASLEIPAEEREAIFGLLPQMTEAQLDKLTNVLEANYLQAASKNPDEQLAGALNSAKEKYQQTVRQMNASTAKELDSIA